MTAGEAVNLRPLGIGLGDGGVGSGPAQGSRSHLPRLDMLLALSIVATAACAAGLVPTWRDGKSLVAVVDKVPWGLPRPHVPGRSNCSWIREMAGSAVAIAFLGLLEALSIAKSIAHQTREPLDYNRQCLAEGLANLGGGFFQCLPGSGSLTRSAINFQSGAVTRWSGVFAAAAVAPGGDCWLRRWPSYIPKSALAGILLVTAAGPDRSAAA